MDARRREVSRFVRLQFCRAAAGGSRKLPLNLNHPRRSVFGLLNKATRGVSDKPGAASGSRLLPSDRASQVAKRLPSRWWVKGSPPTGRQTAEIQGLALPVDVRQEVYPRPSLDNRWRSVAAESF
jgi:hypothetical protein